VDQLAKNISSAAKSRCGFAAFAARLNGLRKKSSWTQKLTAGAKARTDSNGLAARLKSGPSQNLRESYFFRSL
jgi:hypothetical protein